MRISYNIHPEIDDFCEIGIYGGMGWKGRPPSITMQYTHIRPLLPIIYIIYICFNYWLNLRPGVHFGNECLSIDPGKKRISDFFWGSEVIQDLLIIASHVGSAADISNLAGHNCHKFTNNERK